MPFELMIDRPAVKPDLSSKARPDCLMQLPWLPLHVLRLQRRALEFLWLLSQAVDSCIFPLCTRAGCKTKAFQFVSKMRTQQSVCGDLNQPETSLNLSYPT